VGLVRFRSPCSGHLWRRWPSSWLRSTFRSPSTPRSSHRRTSRLPRPARIQPSQRKRGKAPAPA
jgi:hypothetical protein